MPTVHETAYPRLKSSISRRELIDLYTPTQAEVELSGRVSKGEQARLAFVILLKTFQRLGYFIALRDVPRSIVEHIGHNQGLLTVPDSMEEYDESGTRRRHVPIIRKYLRVKSFERVDRPCCRTRCGWLQLEWRILPTSLTWPSKSCAEGTVLRQRQRVHLSTDGPVGLPQRSEDRLLPTGQAYGQRLLRVVQWNLPGRVPGHELVSVSERSSAHHRAMAAGIQCELSSQGSGRQNTY
jgi:Domain of unknown function (DUF4158)